MTIVADSSYLQNDFTKLKQNTFKHYDPGFSGKVLYFTPKGVFVSGWSYKKGKLTAQLISNGTKKINLLKTLDGPAGTDPTQDGDGSSGGGSCTDWWYILSSGDDIISVTYLGRTCDGTQPQSGDGGYVYPDVTGGYNPPPPPKIKQDSLKKHFPCASTLIIDKLLTDPSYAAFVSQFNTSQRPDLNWENSNLPWNVSNTNGSKTYQLGATTPNGWSATISLNTSMLQNSSQLLIAAAAIHETLHAYITNALYTVVDSLNQERSANSWIGSVAVYFNYYYYNLSTNYLDHYSMINDYYDQAVAILAKWDNNAHTLAEYRMAMLFGTDNAGDNTDQYEKNLLINAYNGIISKYGLSQTTIEAFNVSQLNATTSQRLPGNCPP
jgi:hypothetical protein